MSDKTLRSAFGATFFTVLFFTVVALVPFSSATVPEPAGALAAAVGAEAALAVKVDRTDAQWRDILTPDQFRVMREGAVEKAFSGRYHDYKGGGRFHCAACGNPMFDANAKMDANTGWPSFRRPLGFSLLKTPDHIRISDREIPIRCARCDSYVGHIIKDAPQGGICYRLNSIALELTRLPDTRN